MPDLDQRVTDGLRELVSRAPVDADLWPTVQRRVARHRRQRHVIVSTVIAVALLAGAFTAVVVRGADSKVVVANPGGTADTTTPRPSGSALTTLAADGPIEGSFTITASPTGGLSFAPSALTVRTGIYAVTLVDGTVAAHTLYFDNPATLWAPQRVGRYSGETKTATSRIFFGQAGTYTFFCAIPGHRDAGMHGVVTVTGPTITLAEADAAGTPSGSRG